MTMKEKMTMNKLWSVLTALVLVWPLTVPAMAEASDSVPYPPRTFLYIVDCSGSMSSYQDALNEGRQMLLDLLPDNTIVVPFAEKVYPATASLTFDKNTSVLAGIRDADERLEKLWADNPDQEVTAVLFSDMYSTVESDGSNAELIEGSEECESEIEELANIASRWSEYVWEGKLRFYSLNWSSDPSDGVRMPFPVPPPPAESAGPLPSIVPDNAEILKTCVEVYAGVLTGRNSAEWKQAETKWSDDVLTVPLDERYREFLYLSERPSRAIGPGGEVLKCWGPPDGCILLVEGAGEGVCSIEGVSTTAQVMSFTIPKPALDVSFSTDPMSVFNPVTISVGVTDGKSYLDYDDSNSTCFLKVLAPGDSTPQVLTSSYDPVQNIHGFTFVPETLGDYEFMLSYMIFGAEQDVRELVFEKESVCTAPVPDGQQFREYIALSQKLQALEKGAEVQFTLSNYYEKPNIGLEFVVEAPEDDAVAAWDSSMDETGTVTVQGRGPGSTVLRYTINCYLEGEDAPCCSEAHELSISVTATRQSALKIVLAAVVGIVVLAVVAAVVAAAVRARKKHAEQMGGGDDGSC